VKSLVSQGYLDRKPSDRDGRSSLFELTPLSRQKLAEDPLEDVVRAAKQLDSTEQARTAAGLRQILLSLAQERGGPVIGVCTLCGHLGTGSDGKTFECQLMREPLIADELEELCIRFKPAA
jgi:DNA-binding MarR family transcriptional regulator